MAKVGIILFWFFRVVAIVLLVLGVVGVIVGVFDRSCMAIGAWGLAGFCLRSAFFTEVTARNVRASFVTGEEER